MSAWFIIALLAALVYDAIRAAVAWIGRAAYRTGCTVAQWGAAL